jgi:hypothetical protein
MSDDPIPADFLNAVKSKLFSIDNPANPDHWKWRNANTHERELLKEREAFVRQNWRKSKKGNDWKVVDRKYHVVITRNGFGNFGFIVNDENERALSRGSSKSKDGAKERAFDAIRELKFAGKV